VRAHLRDQGVEGSRLTGLHSLEEGAIDREGHDGSLCEARAERLDRQTRRISGACDLPGL
jgi:hypothetical protein